MGWQFQGTKLAQFFFIHVYKLIAKIFTQTKLANSNVIVITDINPKSNFGAHIQSTNHTHEKTSHINSHVQYILNKRRKLYQLTIAFISGYVIYREHVSHNLITSQGTNQFPNRLTFWFSHTKHVFVIILNTYKKYI